MQQIYCNGVIRTMCGAQTVEAVLVENGVIAATGNERDLMQAAPQAQRVDLGGNTMLPSFFVAHVYHWGDIHMQNFGMERASAISPAKSALNQGICFTFHQDTPVIEPDMLETVWCAVNRKTKKGVTLGKDETISVMEALKAVTINAAYQYGEEAQKGSIEPGKHADFVILDGDPVTVAPMGIRSIKIVKTIKDGEVIYRQ